jgi:hypothetical protein
VVRHDVLVIAAWHGLKHGVRKGHCHTNRL